MSSPKFPKPDRSNFKPNFEKTLENDTLDIAWNEGVLSDGRPFRVECWAGDQVTHLTYSFSIQGLKEKSKEDFIKFIGKGRLLEFISDKKFLGANIWKDASGNEMWSVNVVVGDEDQVYVEDYVPLKRYLKTPLEESKLPSENPE